MSRNTQIKNIEDLRNDLLSVYDNLKSGDIGMREAKTRNSTAVTIIKTCSLQLEYNAYTKSDARIQFLESNNGI